MQAQKKPMYALPQSTYYSHINIFASFALSVFLSPLNTEVFESKLHTSWPFTPRYFNAYFLKIRTFLHNCRRVNFFSYLTLMYFNLVPYYDIFSPPGASSLASDKASGYPDSLLYHQYFGWMNIGSPIFKYKIPHFEFDWCFFLEPGYAFLARILPKWCCVLFRASQLGSLVTCPSLTMVNSDQLVKVPTFPTVHPLGMSSQYL